MLDYRTKCNILSDLWENYRDEEAFTDFIEYNDLGLPMAYMLKEGLINEVTETGQIYINETFLLFITALGVEEKEIEDGTTLDNLLDFAEKKQNP
jgi:hypothetical protein